MISAIVATALAFTPPSTLVTQLRCHDSTCPTRTGIPIAMAPRIRPPPPSQSPDEDGRMARDAAEQAERDKLYAGPFSDGVDFDATTVLALLGGAIAFNFFVLANIDIFG